MPRTTAISALVIVAVAASLTASQSKPAPGAPPSYDQLRVEYHRLLRAYVDGDADKAVAGLAQLQPAWSEGVIRRIDLRFDLQMFLAGVMLETEAAFTSARGDVLVDRLANADLWLARIKGNKGLPAALWVDFRRQWSLVVGRRVLWVAVTGTADRILSDACDLFKDDVRLHVAYGLARETTAFTTGATTPFDRSAASSVRKRGLTDARNAFERALQLDPESNDAIEARVRLAHVYVLLGDDVRAAPLLNETLSRNAPPIYKYLAAVMLGDVDARAGRTEKALGLYLGARNVIPGAQNTFVAHAHALRAAGRADEAVAVLNEMLMRPERVEDPWVQYPKGLDADIIKLEPLRGYVRQMGTR